MMLDRAHLSVRREDMRQRALPLRRVRTLAVAAHGRGIEHRLDTASHSGRRFRLLRPDRVEYLHDEPGVDRGDGKSAESRIAIGGERVAPLLAMLRVAPARLVAGDEFF